MSVLLFEPQSRLFYRSDSTDLDFIKSMQREYGHINVNGQVVMDCGACFGAFTRWAVMRGASSIVAYEPLPMNFELLRKNVEYSNMVSTVTTIPAALVPSYDPVVDFYVTGGRSFGNSSLINFRGRGCMKVRSVNFRDELGRFKPTVVKMDVEGAEYGLLAEPLPDFVRQFTLELHFTKKEWRSLGRQLHDSLTRDQGFKVVREPKIGEKNWNTIGGYER